MIYDGLVAPNSGPCQGLYQLANNAGCTHGPDEAPAGYSVGSTSAPVSAAPSSASFVCDGDGVSGYRVQVVYAHASDVPDRYAGYLASFQQWAADTDAIFSQSALQTGADRHLRFVQDGNCVPTVANVTLSPTGDDSFDNMETELRQQGYNLANRRYLVFMDARVYCGVGSFWLDDKPSADNYNNQGPRYGRVDSGCWGGVIAAHELMHTFGGVQFSAPHTDRTTHCTDGYDDMCDHSGNPAVTFTTCPDPAGDSQFDCNKDDYYNTNPDPTSYLGTHWNAANSVYLIGAAAPQPPPAPSPTATQTPSSTPQPPAPTATPVPTQPPAPTPVPTQPPQQVTARVDSALTGNMPRNQSFKPSDLFKRGSNVTVKAHMEDSSGLSLANASVTLSLHQPDGSTFCTMKVNSDANGNAYGTCKLQKGAQSGDWNAMVDGVDKSGYRLDPANSVLDHPFAVQ
jgi:hypothetical protein